MWLSGRKQLQWVHTKFHWFLSLYWKPCKVWGGYREPNKQKLWLLLLQSTIEKLGWQLLLFLIGYQRSRRPWRLTNTSSSPQAHSLQRWKYEWLVLYLHKDQQLAKVPRQYQNTCTSWNSGGLLFHSLGQYSSRSRLSMPLWIQQVSCK